ncbi:MAG: hypothetical protein R2848_08145 [Thermomicrobiales bacterium]
MRDLFDNVPARRKFQRQPSTESGLITRLVGAYAAAYPGDWLLIRCGRAAQLLDSGSGDLIEAATSVHGIDVGRAAIELQEPDLDARVPGVTVTGWLCAPTVTRSHRQQMIFFVNGRQIQSRTLMYALEEAYHTLLMVGRHPVTLVRISLDPEFVDVNVHPTKAEVKFADERAVLGPSRAAHATLSRIPRAEPSPHSDRELRTSCRRILAHIVAGYRPPAVSTAAISTAAVLERVQSTPATGSRGATPVAPNASSAWAGREHVHHRGGARRAVHDRPACRARTGRI